MISRLAGLLLILVAAPIGLPLAAACDAQRENETYLDARAEVAQLPAADRARLAAEWAALEAEQKSLWKLAGEVDEACRRGELSPEAASYHFRVLEWEGKLHQFLRRMHAPRTSASARPEAPLPNTGAPPPGEAPRELEFPGAVTPPPPPTPPSRAPVTPRPAPPTPHPGRTAEPTESVQPKTLL